MAIRMGTMYELNRSRIVEIENEKEAKKERCRMVCISSAIVFLQIGRASCRERV